MFYTDWYEHDYENNRDFMAELSKLPQLMENDTHDTRPNSSDIFTMLDGLKDIYYQHKPQTANLVKTILKDLCRMGRTRPQYDKALKDNLVEYLGLSLSVFKDDKKTLAEITKYCQAHSPEKSLTIEAMKYNETHKHISELGIILSK